MLEKKMLKYNSNWLTSRIEHYVSILKYIISTIVEIEKDISINPICFVMLLILMENIKTYNMGYNPYYVN